MYGIYVTKTNSNNHTSANMGWYRDAHYPTMSAAKKALAHIIEMLNEDYYTVEQINTVTVKGERTDTTPYPVTNRVQYHIEKR